MAWKVWLEKVEPKKKNIDMEDSALIGSHYFLIASFKATYPSL